LELVLLLPLLLLDTTPTSICASPKKVALVLITKAVKVNRSQDEGKPRPKADITEIYSKCLIYSMPIYLNFSNKARQRNNRCDEDISKLKEELRKECILLWRKFSD